MTRLVAIRDDEFIDLDHPDAQIELSFAVKDLRDISSLRASFSLSFRLPFSRKNMDFFGGVNDPAYTSGDYNWNEKTQAMLYEDGVIVMRGTLHVDSIDLTQKHYNCTFYEATVDFFDSLKGKTWQDVWRDSSDNVDCPFDHAITSANIKETWDNGYLGPLGGMPLDTIRYALFDTGTTFLGKRFPASGTSWGASQNNTGIDPTCLRPAIKVDWLLDELFNYAGFTRLSTCFFKVSDYNADNLWCIIGTQFDRMPTRNSYGFRVNAPEQTYLADTEALVPFSNTSGTGLYDPDSVFIAAGAFYPNFSGQYQFSLQFESTNITDASIPIQVTLLNDNGILSTFQITFAQVFDNLYYTFTANVEENVATILTLKPAFLDADIEVTFGFHDYGYSNTDGFLDGAKAMGDKTLDKWVKALCDKFNLVIDVNSYERTAQFITYDDYMAPYQVDATVNDWTQKIDRNGSFVMKPATEYQKERLIFQDMESADHKNEWYQRSFGQVRGAHYQTSRNSYSEGEETVGDFFTPMRLTRIKSHWDTNGTAQGFWEYPIILMEAWNSWTGEGCQYEELGPVLCFYHGNQDVFLALGYDEVDIDNILLAPLFTPYSDSGAASDIYTLDYSVPAPDLTDTTEIGLPQKGLIGKFWYNYLSTLYSGDARVVECDAYLSADDIANLDFRNRVRVDNQLYRLVSIDNYVVGRNEPCRVVLFRETAMSLSDCGLVPTVQADGRVTWQDGDGAVVSPTAFCCDSWGYYWQSDNNTCTIFAQWGQETYANIWEPVVYDTGGEVLRTNANELQNTPTNTAAYGAGGVAPFRYAKYIMHTTSTSSSPVYATVSVDGADRIWMGSETSFRIVIEYMAVDVDPTSADFGESYSGTVHVNVYTEKGAATTKDTVEVAKTGPSPSVTAEFEVTDVTNKGSYGKVKCTGPTAKTVLWHVITHVTSYNYGAHATDTLVFAQFMDGDTILFQDGDIMQYK